MTSTNTLGIRNGNQIVAYGATTKRTKEIALTIGTVTTSAGNVSSPAVIRAVAVFYADSNGVWRMRFNVRITFTAITCTTVTVPVTGVLFKSQSGTFYQSTSGFFDSAAPIQCFAFPNTANLYATLASTNISAVGFSGDVELESEPTTYTIAANMEGAVNASVYIPAADASTTGLITAGAQTVAGVKTFNDGVKLPTSGGTAGTLDFYEVYTHTSTMQNMSASAPAYVLHVARVGKLVTISSATDLRIASKLNNVGPNVSDILPTRFRPQNTVSSHADISDNNAERNGLVLVTSAGSVSFSKPETAVWTASQPCAVYSFTISYVVA